MRGLAVRVRLRAFWDQEWGRVYRRTLVALITGKKESIFVNGGYRENRCHKSKFQNRHRACR